VSLRIGQEIQALPRPHRLTRLLPVDKGALASPVLVLGAPRSGTTWLAKIIDSHPDVIYRHEPDEARPPLDPVADVRALIRDWAQERSAKTVTKRPFFAKSWQSAPARALRTLIVGAVGAASRMPPPFRALSGLRVPDLMSRQAEKLVIKSISWAAGAAIMATALPASRTILILRHPCGQVWSVMRGNRQQRFDLGTAGTDMPFNEARAVQYAARHGTGEPAFQALPDAAKYAWSWRAFNEPAYAGLAAQANVYVVLYEALCAQPGPQARQVMEFAGLDWHQQTAAFVARSTSHTGDAGYYAVYRNAVVAADAWRSAMPVADQDAVRTVLADSPLARLWPDLLGH
jgi:hypothetical protein